MYSSNQADKITASCTASSLYNVNRAPQSGAVQSPGPCSGPLYTNLVSYSCLEKVTLIKPTILYSIGGGTIR